MSVSRSIDVRLLAEVDALPELLSKLIEDTYTVWDEQGKINSISELDEDFDYQNFDDIEAVFASMKKREAAGKVNVITLWESALSKGFLLLVNRLETGSYGSKKHYSFSFSPLNAQKIAGASRFTDYGYYLQQLLPKLLAVGCTICEVVCRDFDF